MKFLRKFLGPLRYLSVVVKRARPEKLNNSDSCSWDAFCSRVSEDAVPHGYLDPAWLSDIGPIRI